MAGVEGDFHVGVSGGILPEAESAPRLVEVVVEGGIPPEAEVGVHAGVEGVDLDLGLVLLRKMVVDP